MGPRIYQEVDAFSFAVNYVKVVEILINILKFLLDIKFLYPSDHRKKLTCKSST